MVRVSVEVREGAALFRVAVQAESIGRAVSIVKGRHPDRDVRVVFPISPEDFFFDDPKNTGRGWTKRTATGYSRPLITV